MRKSKTSLVLCSSLFVLIATVCSAHFGMIIPSNDVVGADDKKNIELTMQFTHPFEGGPIMQMDKPEKFGVEVWGVVENNLPDLKHSILEVLPPLDQRERELSEPDE